MCWVKILSRRYPYRDSRLRQRKVSQEVVLEGGEVLRLADMPLDGVDKGVAVERGNNWRGWECQSGGYPRKRLHQGVKIDKVCPSAKRAGDLQVCRRTSQRQSSQARRRRSRL